MVMTVGHGAVEGPGGIVWIGKVATAGVMLVRAKKGMPLVDLPHLLVESVEVLAGVEETLHLREGQRN